MRCYSHLSDDEREQIGLFDRRDRPSDRPSEVDGLARTLPPHSPPHAGKAYQLRRRREARIERDRTLRTFRCRPARVRLGPRANRQNEIKPRPGSPSFRLYEKPVNHTSSRSARPRRVHRVPGGGLGFPERHFMQG